jgi:hypothetical protein
MSEAAQELTTELVQSRVTDWKSRLRALYDDVENAARRASIIRVSRDGMPGRHEGPMQRFGIPAPMLERLTVSGRAGTLEIVPVALWVVGANGRADLVITERSGRRHAAILADVGERGGSTPHWQLFEQGGRNDGADFDSRLMDEMMARIR